jgi:membrane protease YdiL (CAAX protease family)
LIPAASAILLGFLSKRCGWERVRESTGRARAFFVVYLALTLAYSLIAAASLISPGLAQPMLLVGSALTILSALALVCLRLAGGRESFTRAGLAFGRPVHWLLFGAGYALFVALEAELNYAFGLGSPVDAAALAVESGMTVEALIVLGLVGVIADAALLGIVIYFGEEFGWRGFLQGELVRLGRARGVFFVGVVWGIWHAPLILMGYNYPGHPVEGILLMTAFCVLLAFLLGYAVLKTGSIWIAALIHGLNNGLLAFLSTTVYRPNDPAYQFQAGGIFGIALLAVVVLLLLRDPIWRETSAGSGHLRVAGDVES